ncbi:MAG: peptide deformylase [Candidatus Magasanikbacteria bacterium]|nr:peptide deformylase [Candidatus Magasanikbacteria bacterium]
MKKQLSIVTHPKNHSLHERCRDVSKEELQTAETKQLIRDMIHTMYKDDGIGIAAPQVGVTIRLAIIGKGAAGTRKDLVICNPTYAPLNADKTTEQEGCLSVPGVWGDTPRHTKIQVRYMAEDGTLHEEIATDFFARVLQHEIDHLDGVLFVDRAKKIWEADRKPTYPMV